MSQINEKIITNLEGNNKTVYINGVEILLKLLDNILNFPENEKYRRIRLDNKIIRDKLLRIRGMIFVLKSIGFCELNNEMFLSTTVYMATLRKYRDFIKLRLEFVTNGTLEASTSKLSQLDTPKVLVEPFPVPAMLPQQPEPIKTPELISIGKPFTEKINFPIILKSDNSVIKTIEQISDQCMQYEDLDLQKYAISLIPMEKLKFKTLEKIRSVQKMIKKENIDKPEPCYKDVFLTELLEWFKLEFFEWVDTLLCTKCNKKSVAVKSNFSDGIRLEQHLCCNTVMTFPRYNDVCMLLQTRKGRCGEFANCFTFLCRSLGYEARFVHANFDHVWTEVYSLNEKRWIHLDSSENIMDVPLCYQVGWKRDVKYVFAFSFDDVQDVTWRYTSNFDKTRTARNECNEDEVLKSVLLIRNKRQQKCTNARKKYLIKRNLAELASFITARKPTKDEEAGRTSGSFMWRSTRGEYSKNTGNTFKLTPKEISSLQFNIRYSCAKDSYQRFIYDGTNKLVTENLNTWESGTYLSKNILRKIEADWKMAYLARTEETDLAKIVWKFDFQESFLVIKSIKLRFDAKVYENGNIKLIIHDEFDDEVHSVDDLVGNESFTITAILTGGKGDIAWQHTQLFRQSTNDGDEYPFEINIELQTDEE